MHAHTQGLSLLYLGRSGWRRYVMPLLSLAFPHLFDQRSIGGMDIVTHRNGAEIFLGAPTVILIFGDIRGIGNVDLDCGIYAHQLVMVAHSLGLGTCYIGFSTPVNLLPSLKKELGVEWPFTKLVTAIAIGHPAVKVDGPVEREIPKVIWHE